MGYNLTFSRDYKKLIQFVYMDARTQTFASPMNGNQIQPIVDSKVAAIGSNSIFYKIETELGVIVGYFVLLVNVSNFSATLQTKQLRPAFFTKNTQIGNIINAFILSNEWQQDILL